MSTIVVVNVPALGHVNPTLSTCTELVRRGHSVHYFCAAPFGEIIRRTGAVFHEVDYGEVERVMVEDPTKVARMLPSAVRAARSFLVAHREVITAARPDVIFYDNTCFWAFDLAKVLGVRSVSSFSVFVMNAAALRSVPGFRMLSPMAMLFRGNPVRQLGGFLSFAGEYRRYLRENGFRRRALRDLWTNEGDLNLVYTSEELQPGGSDLVGRYRFIGTIPREEDEDDFAIPEGDEPLVYVSLGTLPHAMTGFLQAVVKAIESCGYRGVVATGRGVPATSLEAPSGKVRVGEFVPQLRVLAHAHVFVSHGGMNSTHESLSHGVPLAFLPRQEEQELVAARVVERGAALSLKESGNDAEAIAEVLRRLATESRFAAAARRLGEGLHNAGINPSDLIEELIGGRPG